MVNRQRNKVQVKIYNILLRIEQHEPHEKTECELVCFGRVYSSCSISVMTKGRNTL